MARRTVAVGSYRRPSRGGDFTVLGALLARDSHGGVRGAGVFLLTEPDATFPNLQARVAARFKATYNKGSGRNE